MGEGKEQDQNKQNPELTSLRPAGFWLRCIAMLIDLLFVTLLSTLAVFLAKGYISDLGYDIQKIWALISLAVLIFVWPYFFVSYLLFRTSIGKVATRIRLINQKGGRISAGQAFVRAFGYLVSMLLIGGGFLFIIGNERKRALHDYMAGTFVVRTIKADEKAGKVAANVRSRLSVLFGDPERKRKSILVAGAATLAIVAIAYIFGVYTAWKWAKNDLQQAQIAAEKASLAAEPNSLIKPNIHRASSLLNHAQNDFKTASIIRPSDYLLSKQEANDAQAAAEIVLNKVNRELAQANEKAQGSANGYEGLFDFYKKYPRTAEARKALIYADAAVKKTAPTQEPHLAVQMIIDFTKAYPVQQRPQGLAGMAKKYYLAYAKSEIDTLRSATESNNSWIATLRAGSSTKTNLQGHTSMEVGELEYAFNNMNLLNQEAGMQNLYAALYEAVKCSARCQQIGTTPSSIEGDAQYFDESQINEVQSANDTAFSRLAEAEQLLAVLSK